MIDKFLTFCTAQAITASAASTDNIDLRAVRQLAVGHEIWCEVHVTTAFTDAGSDSTVTVTIESDDSGSFGSAVTRQTLGTFAALSAAGTQLKVPLQIFGTAERFIRLQFTVANGNLSTGNITGYLTLTPQEATLYAKNYTISG